MDENQTTPEAVETTQTDTTSEEKETSLIQKMIKMIKGESAAEQPASEKPEEGSGKEVKEKKEPADATKTLSQTDLENTLKAEREKWEKEQTEKERVSKLSPEDRKLDEEKKTTEKIAELENKLLFKELNEKVIESFSSEGFPVDLAKVINYKNEEDMKERVEIVKAVWKSCMEEALRIALKGKTPDGLGDASKKENSLSAQVASAIKGGI